MMPDQIQITHQPRTMTTPTISGALTSDDIPPGPLSEDDLRQRWNQQADEYNQWESLDSAEQLAWAQARAIAADRALSQPLAETSATGALTDIQLWELLPKRLEQNLLAMVQLAAPHYKLKPIDLLQYIAPDFVDYARAVLASDRARRIAQEAEPKGRQPTDEDLYDLAEQFNGDPVAAMRHALDLWGNPLQGAPEPGENPAAAPAPAPETPAEALAVRPLLERVAQLGDAIGRQTVAQVQQLANQAAVWLRENPPGQPVAIEPRACPTPGACSCVEPTLQAPEPGEAKELHPLWYLIEFLEGHSSVLRRTDPMDELAQVLSDSATLLKRLASPAYLVVGRPPEGCLESLKSESGQVEACTAGVSIELLGDAPRPTYLDAIRLAEGCHDYSGGYSGPEGDAWHNAINTVVDVLKRAAVKPWDSQTRAVFGVGAEAQAGDVEA